MLNTWNWWKNVKSDLFCTIIRDLLCTGGNRPSEECKHVKYVSFHVLPRVKKLFSSHKAGLHSSLSLLQRMTAYLFREALYRPASAIHGRAVIHKWQIGSNCQPWCPKGSWAVSLLLGSPTLSRKTRTEHVDVRDGARLLWIRGSLSGTSLGDLLPSFRPCLKAS